MLKILKNASSQMGHFLLSSLHVRLSSSSPSSLPACEIQYETYRGVMTDGKWWRGLLRVVNAEMTAVVRLK